jgi:prevent-host-death family protein
METVNIGQAKRQLSRLIQRVINGEQIIIANRGKPVAVLTGIGTASAERVPGIDAGLVVIYDDFDAPLPEFER